MYGLQITYKDYFTAFLKKQRDLLLLFLLLSCIPAFSQRQDIPFQQVGSNAGLGESNVLSILQDDRGFMWFGTGNGLYKYDGYSFTTYKYNRKNSKGISANIIPSIAKSKNGDLWFATSGGGVCRYDRRKDQFFRYQNDVNNHNSIAVDDVNALLEDNEGKLWIGMTDGLDVYDQQTKTFTHYRHDEKDSTSVGDNYITNIFEDSEHNIWIATMKGGLNLFNRQTKHFTHFRHSRYDHTTISSDEIYVVFEDSRRRLWIGTGENGLDLFLKEKKRFYNFRHSDNDKNSLSNNSIRAIEEGNDGKLWIGTENGGITVFDPELSIFHYYTTDEHDNTSLATNSINTIYKDHKGNIWVGTFNAGISLVDVDAGKFGHYRHLPGVNGLSNNKVLCFYEDSRKNIWIGTDGGGLNLFDPQTNHFTHLRHDKNNKKSICGDNVLSVCEDADGNIWIGTWGEGVTVFNPRLHVFRHFKNDPYDPTSLSNNNAWAVFCDKEKNIWIGTYGGGLNKFDPATNSFTIYQHDQTNEHSISDNWINSMYEDSDGNFWICTSGSGLSLFDKKNKSFTRFQYQPGVNSIGSNNTNSITEDRNKNLWISTTSGLNFYNKKTKKFSAYSADNGLPGDNIFGILEDGDGNLWISTDKGISCLNPADTSFKNFGVADGLQSDKFKEQAFCKSSSGVMYFGGNNGFNQFIPQHIKTIPFEPPLVITSFQLFNKEVVVAEEGNTSSPLKENITEAKNIVLSYSHSLFSFSFASLNYSSSEKKRYAYMLEGFDNTWNEVGTRNTATYTNLDPGKYIFKVRGLNNEGKWSPYITSINLTITPPFWRTWWFRISVILFITGIITVIYLARMKAVKKQQSILEQKVKDQTIQLVHSNEEERKARVEADYANNELAKKNKELEQFVYIASHDLREPLRTTNSFVELFQKQYKGKLDEKADTYLSFISQASERMKTLVNDLLDYSRLGNKKDLEQVDCNVILKDVTTDLNTALNEVNARVIADPLPVMTAHATSIKLLFQNLIANGIKFRKKDTHPEIKISSRCDESHWQFSIADNGIGIEEKHKERIFMIFQRLHTRSEYEGSGIGLAHCKKIVELHGGRIWVESNPGQGSTFYFTIHKKNIQ